MTKKRMASRAPVRTQGSTLAIATASAFIALAAALSFVVDKNDDGRSLHLRGSLAAGDTGAASVQLPAPPKHA